MDAKDKAKEIINLFKNVPIFISQEPKDIDSTMSYIDNDAVKNCAKIAVEEILKELPILEHHPLGSYANPRIDFYEQVLKEIETI